MNHNISDLKGGNTKLYSCWFIAFGYVKICFK